VCLPSARYFKVIRASCEKAFKYLLALSAKGPKPNVEANLNAEFRRVLASTVSTAKESAVKLLEARLSCLWPAGGIQDNTVNRLLLMSSSEDHLASAPMALFVKTGKYKHPKGLL